MSEKDQIKARLVREFAFLQSKGFEFESFVYFEKAFGDWQMTLRSSKCFMRVSKERYGDIQIIFRPIIPSGPIRWFGLGTLIYYLSSGRNFIGLFGGSWRDMQGQFDRFAEILNANIDEIVTLFNDDFEKHTHALEEMAKPLFDLNMAEYKKREKKGLD